MAEVREQHIIRATKEETFNVLKSAAASLFNSKTWEDVEFFGDDPQDSSKFILRFAEEARD